MPLVDHGELHEDDEGRGKVVEVVLAVPPTGKQGILESWIPTFQGVRSIGVGWEVLDFAVEQLHANDSKHTIHNLGRESPSPASPASCKPQGELSIPAAFPVSTGTARGWGAAQAPTAITKQQ